MAVISLGDIVVSQSIRVGGDEMDEGIVNYCKREHQLAIGHQMLAPAAHAADERAQADREDVLSLELAPHSA